MANHMAEVAKMLGVELGEEFTTDISGIPLYFAEDGVFGLHDDIKQDGILRALLSGRQKVIKYRSTPSRGEAFWYIAKMVKLIVSYGKVRLLIFYYVELATATAPVKKPRPTVISGSSFIRRTKCWRCN